MEEGDQSDEEIQPCIRGRDEFVDFIERNSFFAPLMRAEASGINLMDVLRKTKSPMNAYAHVMDWHLREKGVLRQDCHIMVRCDTEEADAFCGKYKPRTSKQHQAHLSAMPCSNHGGWRSSSKLPPENTGTDRKAGY